MQAKTKVSVGVLFLLVALSVSAQTLVRKQLAQLEPSGGNNSVTIIPLDRPAPSVTPSVPYSENIPVNPVPGGTGVQGRSLESSQTIQSIEQLDKKPNKEHAEGRPIPMGESHHQDIEILNLQPDLTATEIEERLKTAEKVDVKESLEEGEWVDDFPVDPCPQTVGGGELGFWFKVGPAERCSLKQQIGNESVLRALDVMMYDSMCTDPKGVQQARYEAIMQEATHPNHKILAKNAAFLQSYENKKNLCNAVAQHAEVFAPVLSVRHVGNAKMGSKTCRAALIEAHALAGIIGLGRFNFIAGLGECTGSVEWMPKADIWYAAEERTRIESGINSAFGWSGKSSKVRFVLPPVLKEPAP